MANDHELRVHRDWISTIQPVGLVVSPPALVAAQAFPDRHIVPQQQALLGLVDGDDAQARKPKRGPLLGDFLTVAREVLGWEDDFVAGSPVRRELPDTLAVTLPEFGETLRPTFAVENLHRGNGEPDWALLVDVLPREAPFDDAGPRRWHASPQIRLERLLGETGVPAGLLFNGGALRLVYAPRGESSGSLTWPFYALCEVQGRPLLSALCMLLGGFRLFAAPKNRSLLHILRESRKYQNVVSTKLAGQVLEALNELLRGFQAANEAAKGRLLDEIVREDPEHVYGGLLAVLLRLVFLLYAEERGLMSTDPVYVGHYALTGLFEKLRIDAGRFPDTMDQRYGAWSRLCVLFRLIFDGAKHGTIQLPPRRGHLFDPNTWSFLEGRSRVGGRQVGGRVDVPKVSDGTVYRVLDKLLMLDGDRLSYRALDVEQIGSVYENMMGFTLERAFEISIGVGRDHVVVGLEELLASKGADRAKLLKEKANAEVTGKAFEALKAATTVDDAVAALARRISSLTPRPIPSNGLYLQPTDERRRSGSHYTPRELTEPIVRTTLRPLLEDLGATPTPDQILSFKICDPAMGSGAFLVETCRQLAEQLVRTWDVHGKPADLPPDEDPLLYAQRQVAQRCLYGVDKNAFAVDLGKLSLWLATLAKNHSFAFLDHAIRHGDSLVGLTREQIASFHWNPEKQISTIRMFIDKALARAESLRREIQSLSRSDDDESKRQKLREADEALDDVRLIGDCVVAAYFAGENDRERKQLRSATEGKVAAWLSSQADRREISNFVEELRGSERPVPCFHWEIEFPEVFGDDRGRFAAFVGNPPFLSGVRISTVFGMPYFSWLTNAFPPAGHLCDLVAYFYRRCFALLRRDGTLGLLATKTIRQGDTREGGLAPILAAGGTIYDVVRRRSWPGRAAVIVSIVHVCKGRTCHPARLDGEDVPRISAFLVPGDLDNTPSKLRTPYFSQGSNICGQGFLFDDHDSEASPLSEMQRILEDHDDSRERVLPYIGGEGLNSDPDQSPRRYVIYFSDISTEEYLLKWPQLAAIVREKVKPVRDALGSNPNNVPLKRRWWAYQAHRPELYSLIRPMKQVLAHSRVSGHLAFSFQPTNIVFADSTNVFAISQMSGFCLLQSRVHECWARFFSSSMKDDLRYTPSDCYETFPFPPGWELNERLEASGRAYYESRARSMQENAEGMTKTYNRFHAPDEAGPRIVKLRALHDAMDRAVLDVYGWTDIHPTCEFLLDYEQPEDENDEGRTGKRKKPWRYRWPDEIRDEVLARLLELNAKRAKEEAAAALTGESSGATKKRGKRGKAAGPQGNLF